MAAWVWWQAKWDQVEAFIASVTIAATSHLRPRRTLPVLGSLINSPAKQAPKRVGPVPRRLRGIETKSPDREAEQGRRELAAALALFDKPWEHSDSGRVVLLAYELPADERAVPVSSCA